MTKGRRAAIYARYSTHSQRSESIEIQLDASRAYCAENGLMVVAEYCDYAQTGTTTDRAEFQRMMADARRGLFDYVVIYKVTRIMRNRDEMAMARIMLRRSHVEILYAGEDIAGGSSGVLQLGMLEVLAEYESALDGGRIRDGMRKDAERCMANGCVRYGWDIVDGRYVVNEDEAAVVRVGVRMILEAGAWPTWCAPGSRTAPSAAAGGITRRCAASSCAERTAASTATRGSRCRAASRRWSRWMRPRGRRGY